MKKLLISIPLIISCLIIIIWNIGDSGSEDWYKAFSTGNRLYEEGEYKKAVTEYNKAINTLKKQIDDDSERRGFIYQVYLSKAGSLKKLDMKEEALDVYKELLNGAAADESDELHTIIYSYKATALIEMGLIYLKTGREELADKRFSESIPFLQQCEIIDYQTKANIDFIIDYYKAHGEDDIVNKFEKIKENL